MRRRFFCASTLPLSTSFPTDRAPHYPRFAESGRESGYKGLRKVVSTQSTPWSIGRTISGMHARPATVGTREPAAVRREAAHTMRLIAMPIKHRRSRWVQPSTRMLFCGVKPTAKAAAAARGAALLSITHRAKGLTGDDDRGESLPDESVDDLDRRAAWAARGQGAGSPRRVSHDVAARSHVGGVDSSTRHEWSECLADLVSIAGIPDESRAQSVRVAAAIGPLRSVERTRDLSHQARHDLRRGSETVRSSVTWLQRDANTTLTFLNTSSAERKLKQLSFTDAPHPLDFLPPLP